jgi:hypothetical protein
MKISELPPEIRALAEKNRAADKVVPGNQSDDLCNAFQFNETPEGLAFWHEWANRHSFASIPSPETLRPLLEAALAVMDPNDPAREHVSSFMSLPVEGRAFYTVHFCSYMEKPIREASGNGPTPQKALDKFKASYAPPPTKDGRIAALRAELAKLEAGQ